MTNICDKGTAASCGTHKQTGSSKVFVEGKGVVRVEVDTAGGLIIGPGSQNIFVEGSKVSLPGDVITTHGKSPHSAAFTKVTQSKVFAGTGFAADEDSTGDEPSVDLVVNPFEPSLSKIDTSGQDRYPPINMYAAWERCHVDEDPPAGWDATPPPTITYYYTVKNKGIDKSQPFVVGFWKFKDADEAPDRAILTMDSIHFYDIDEDGEPDVELISQESAPALAPGESFSGTFRYELPYYLDVGKYAFGIYADIHNAATERSERNSAPTLIMNVTDKC